MVRTPGWKTDKRTLSTCKRSKALPPGLDQMGDEEAEAVPGCGDDDSGAESPWAISPRQDDDCHIDERLQKVEKAKLRNEGR